MPAKKQQPRIVNQPMRRRPMQNRLRGNQDTLNVHYKELWSPVTGVEAGASDTRPQPLIFMPGNSGLPHLDALGRLYESYKMTGDVRLEFKTAAGSVNNGSVIAGVDYDARDASLGYIDAAALSPKFVGSITKDHSLSVTAARAMNKKWLFTSSQTEAAGEAAFAIVYSTTGTTGSGRTVGDLWIEYQVQFISPKRSEILVSTELTTIGADGVTYNTVSNDTDATRLSVHAANRFGENSVIRTGVLTSRDLLPATYRLLVSMTDAGGTQEVLNRLVTNANIGAFYVTDQGNNYQDWLFRVVSTIAAGGELFQVSRLKPDAQVGSVALTLARTLISLL